MKPRKLVDNPKEYMDKDNPARPGQNKQKGLARNKKCYLTV